MAYHAVKVSNLFIFPGILFCACAKGASSLRIAPQYQEVKWYDHPTDDHYISFRSPLRKLRTDACFLVDGECYMKQLLQNDSVVISQWFGRIGNNLHQISNAIFAAKLSGKGYVTTPADGPIREIFDLPENIKIEPDEEFRTRVACRGSSRHYYYARCHGVKQADYTKVLRAHLLPYLNAEARDACKQEASKTKRELVLHLRSGDLLSSRHYQSKFAPCTFFHALINQASEFEHIRVITEPDRKHPCLHFFAERNLNVTVQSGSLPADACAFMHATHLGLGAASTFSRMLTLFNTHPVTLEEPFGPCEHSETPEEPVCQHGKKVMYCIPGIETIRTGRNKVDWMLHYSKEHITKDSEQCLE